MADVVGLHKVVLAFNHDSGHLSTKDRVSPDRVEARGCRTATAITKRPDAFIAGVVDVIVQNVIMRSKDVHAHSLRESSRGRADVESDYSNVVRRDLETVRQDTALRLERDGRI